MDPNLSGDRQTRVYIHRLAFSTKPRPPLDVMRWLQAAAAVVAGGAGGQPWNPTSAVEDLARAFHLDHAGFVISNGVFTTWIDYLYRVTLSEADAQGADRFEVEILRYKTRQDEFELVCERLPLTQIVARLAEPTGLAEWKKATRRRPPAGL